MNCLNCSHEFSPLFLKDCSDQRIMVCGSCLAIQGKKARKPDSGWFDAGYSVFKADRLLPGLFPPADDFKAIHKWLSGFSMARAETPGEVTMESILSQEQSSCPDIQDELLRILKYPLYKIVWSRIEEFILNHYVGGR